MPTTEQSLAITKIVQAMEALKQVPTKAIEKDANRLSVALINLDLISIHLWEEMGVPRDIFLNGNQ